MLLLLALACTADPAPKPPPGEGAGPVEDSGRAPDSGPAGDTGPGWPDSWTDAVTRGAELDLQGGRPELTDGVLAGDVLVLAGQEQQGQGGLWRYDLSDRDAPVLTGKTAIRHIQRVCADGRGYVWGTTREGRLARFDVTGDLPVEVDSQQGGGFEGGLDCDGDRLVWAQGADGAFVRALGVAGPPQLLAAPGQGEDVLLDGEVLWVSGGEGLTAWELRADTVVQRGRVPLAGVCGDVARGPAGLLAVACGSAGVFLVTADPDAPAVVGRWFGYASARRVAAAGGARLLVAAWTDLLVLDVSDPAAPALVATEPTHTATMSVVADGPDRAYVAEWRSPFVAHLQDGLAPDVRASARHAVPGAVTRIHNDGPAPLTLDVPSAGTLDDTVVPPGGSTRWTLPDDLSGGASLGSDDPDEPELHLVPAGLDGPVLGAPAPGFVEPTLGGAVVDLEALRGQVVFLGVLSDGCPVCSSEVGDTEATLQAGLATDGAWPDGFVRLWAFDGQESRARVWAETMGLAEPVLVDADHSLRGDYFVRSGTDGAFAANPRHYVIDREGTLVWMSTTVAPGGLLDAIEDALAR